MKKIIIYLIISLVGCSIKKDIKVYDDSHIEENNKEYSKIGFIGSLSQVKDDTIVIVYEKDKKQYKTIFKEYTFFDFGKYSIKVKGKKKLNKLIEILEKKNVQKLKIIGHTDNIGSKKYNKQLSINRAIEVSNYLLNNSSISMKNTIVEGKGEEEPLYTNTTAEGREKNRRVEIIWK